MIFIGFLSISIDTLMIFIAWISSYFRMMSDIYFNDVGAICHNFLLTFGLQLVVFVSIWFYLPPFATCLGPCNAGFCNPGRCNPGFLQHCPPQILAKCRRGAILDRGVRFAPIPSGGGRGATTPWDPYHQGGEGQAKEYNIGVHRPL